MTTTIMTPQAVPLFSGGSMTSLTPSATSASISSQIPSSASVTRDSSGFASNIVNPSVLPARTTLAVFDHTTLATIAQQVQRPTQEQPIISAAPAILTISIPNSTGHVSQIAPAAQPVPLTTTSLPSTAAPSSVPSVAPSPTTSPVLVTGTRGRRLSTTTLSTSNLQQNSSGPRASRLRTFSSGQSRRRKSIEEDDVSMDESEYDKDAPDDESGEITCICSFEEDDGFTIQCEKCLIWQHAVCMKIDKNSVPEQYFCEKCEPRAVDRQAATAAQRAQRAKRSRGDRPRKPRSRTMSTSASFESLPGASQVTPPTTAQAIPAMMSSSLASFARDVSDTLSATTPSVDADRPVSGFTQNTLRSIMNTSTSGSSTVDDGSSGTPRKTLSREELKIQRIMASFQRLEDRQSRKRTKPALNSSSELPPSPPTTPSVNGDSYSAHNNDDERKRKISVDYANNIMEQLENKRSRSTSPSSLVSKRQRDQQRSHGAVNGRSGSSLRPHSPLENLDSDEPATRVESSSSRSPSPSQNTREVLSTEQSPQAQPSSAPPPTQFKGKKAWMKTYMETSSSTTTTTEDEVKESKESVSISSVPPPACPEPVSTTPAHFILKKKQIAHSFMKPSDEPVAPVVAATAAAKVDPEVLPLPKSLPPKARKVGFDILEMVALVNDTHKLDKSASPESVAPSNLLSSVTPAKLTQSPGTEQQTASLPGSTSAAVSPSSGTTVVPTTVADSSQQQSEHLSVPSSPVIPPVVSSIVEEPSAATDESYGDVNSKTKVSLKDYRNKKRTLSTANTGMEELSPGLPTRNDASPLHKPADYFSQSVSPQATPDASARRPSLKPTSLVVPPPQFENISPTHSPRGDSDSSSKSTSPMETSLKHPVSSPAFAKQQSEFAPRLSPTPSGTATATVTASVPSGQPPVFMQPMPNVTSTSTTSTNTAILPNPSQPPYYPLNGRPALYPLMYTTPPPPQMFPNMQYRPGFPPPPFMSPQLISRPPSSDRK